MTDGPSELHRQGDALAEALLERREKLNYFLVSASVAIVAFTLNNILTRPARFGGGRFLIVVLGCLALITAAGCSLLLIHMRHEQAWRYIDLAMYQGDGDKANEEMDAPYQRMGQLVKLAGVLFFGGVLTLAGAYLWAIASLAS